MTNLIFALNATMPVFLVMVAGYFLKRVGIVDDAFSAKLNRFVFLVSLPVTLVRQMATADFRSVWDTKFVLYCFAATVVSIGICWYLSKFIKHQSERGEFIQASYRSSAALLGMAYMTGIYGNAEALPLMIIGSVPLYNIAAVTILELTAPDHKSGDKMGKELAKTMIGIIKNPILIGIIVGFLWSLLRIPMPKILNSVMTSIGGTSTPLGLIAMGASIKPKEIKGELRDCFFASAIKLVLLCAVFLPVAGLIGFREQKLIAALVMLGSPATISCYIMACNMGHKGDLTSGTVMLSTVLGAFSMTFWIFLIKTMGWL